MKSKTIKINTQELSQSAEDFSPDALLSFKPHEPDQLPPFLSEKNEVILLAGNKSGKTYMGHAKAGFLLVPEKDIYNKNTGWLLDPFIRRRVPLGKRLIGWISCWSQDQQRTTIQQTFDRLLGKHFKIRSESGIYLEAIGEIGDIYFKTQKQGALAYTGANIDYAYLDEPHSRIIYHETRHRFDITKGTLWFGFTGVIDAKDPDYMHKLNLVDWIKTEIVEPFERNPDDFPLLDIFYMNTESNPLIDMDFFEGKLSGLTNEEKIIRKTGRLITITGQTLLSGIMIDDCKQYLNEHYEEYVPEYGTLEYDDVSNDEYGIMFNQRDREGFFPDYPREGWSWKIWEHPMKETFARPKYFLGADTAGEGKQGDYFCAYIIRGDNKKIVAGLHGYFSDEADFARELWKGGYYYCDSLDDPAYICIEVGLSSVTLEYLINGSVENRIKAYKHNKLYMRTMEDIVLIGHKPTANVGWKTSSRTRAKLLNAMAENLLTCHRAISTGRVFTIPDRAWFVEAEAFIMNPQGKYEAPKGRHDDRLFARALAEMAYEQGYRPTLALTNKNKKSPKDLFYFDDNGRLIINVDGQYDTKRKVRRRTY